MSRGRIETRFARMTGTRRGRLAVAVAVAASLATLGIAPSALAASFQKQFAPFATCPVNTPGVTQCLVSKVTSGEFIIGNNTVPINKTILLKGGYKPSTHEIVPPTDGETLSKTPLVLPGGLLGIELLGNLTEVTVTAELAGTAHLFLANIGGAGPLVSLPLKTKLDNPLLGPACYIGSDSEPITLSLTDGTTNPPPPNVSISGKSGEPVIEAEGRIIGLDNNTLVDNAFAAPGANGCAGILAPVVDLSVDLKAGIPAAAGKNTAIMNGGLRQSEARIVKSEQEIPEFGHCVKVEGVAEGKTIKYNGKYSNASCVNEAVETLKPGKFEWSTGPGPNPKFTGTSEITSLETVGKAKVKCSSGSSSGEYKTAKTETVTFTFSGCEEALHNSCQSSSASSGEIHTSTLVGELGYTKDNEPLKPLIGLDLQPAPPASDVATFECGGVQQTVAGSVIGSVPGIDKMVSALTLKFAASHGIQFPQAFEEGPQDTLTTTVGTGPAEQTGLTGKSLSANEEPIEIKARAF